MTKTSLRQIIDDHIERAFLAGAEWALGLTGVDSALADRQVKQWRRRHYDVAVDHPAVGPRFDLPGVAHRRH